MVDSIRGEPRAELITEIVELAQLGTRPAEERVRPGGESYTEHGDVVTALLLDHRVHDEIAPSIATDGDRLARDDAQPLQPGVDGLIAALDQAISEQHERVAGLDLEHVFSVCRKRAHAERQARRATDELCVAVAADAQEWQVAGAREPQTPLGGVEWWAHASRPLVLVVHQETVDGRHERGRRALLSRGRAQHGP